MGMDDVSSHLEKIIKPSSSSNNTSSNSSKHNSMNEINSIQNAQNVKNLSNNVLYKHQGQKWNQLFDFDKILLQLKSAEKQLKNKKCDLYGTNNICQGCNPENSNRTDSSRKGSRVVKQVQRLDGKDRHYYGIVGNKTFLDIIVCNICSGSYTKMGFNNHMMLQHPTVWSTISTKVILSDNNEGIKILSPMNATSSVTSKIPSEIPFSLDEPSTSSNSSRHKSRKSSSKSGNSSSSGRSKSKSKHHSHSHSKHSDSKTSSESSKKSSKSSSNGSGTNNSNGSKKGSNSMETLGSVNISKDSKTSAIPPYSTSHQNSALSNASPALPVTKKNTLNTIVNTSDAFLPPMPVSEKTFLPNDQLKEKVSSTTSKKKSKSSAYSSHSNPDLHDSHAGTESSGKSSKSSLSSGSSKSSTSKTGSSGNSKKSKSDLKRNIIETHLNETVTSLSSVKRMQCTDDDTLKNIVNVTSNKTAIAVGAYRKPPLIVDRKREKQFVIPTEIETTDDAAAEAATFFEQGVDTQIDTSTYSQDSTMDNTILALDMLENKLINELLRTTEVETHYNENLTEDSNQNVYQPQQAMKRIRYNGEDVDTIIQQSADLSEDFGVQHKQHYTNYNSVSEIEEELKMLEAQHQNISMDISCEYQTKLENQSHNHHHHHQQQELRQQQHENYMQSQRHQEQISTMDGTQLQQYNFEQQNHFDETQYNEQHQLQNTLNCTTNEVKLEDFNTLPEINNTYDTSNMIESEFQLYNIASITDEAPNMNENTLINNCNQTEYNAVLRLPQTNEGQQVIYEISENNQVAVLNQDSQQEVINDLLNEGCYENMQYMNVSSNTDESSEWFDFDFSRIETTKVFTDNNAGNNAQLKPQRSNYSLMTHLKFHEDYYLNSFVYPRLPRPLAMNTFGLVKLPWSSGASFRKQIIASRKANNSPLTLNNYKNSGVSSLGGSSYRINNANTRLMSNEMSSGSVPQTSSLSNLLQSQPSTSLFANKQQNLPNGYIESPLVTNAQSKMRPRSTSSVSNSNTQMGNGITTSIGHVRFDSHPQSIRTIFVNNCANCVLPQDNIIKRNVIASCPEQKTSYFTAHQLSNFLWSGKNKLETPGYPPTINVDSLHDRKELLLDNMKLMRMNNFYNQRKKLMNVISNPPIQRQKNHYKQMLFKQRLMKNFADYGVYTNSNCKLNTTSSSISSNSSTSTTTFASNASVTNGNASISGNSTSTNTSNNNSNSGETTHLFV